MISRAEITSTGEVVRMLERPSVAREPVTTTSFNSVWLAAKRISRLVRPFSGTVWVSEPTAENTSVAVPGTLVRLKRPSPSVLVPLVVPCWSTVTPGWVWPVASSTRPVTVEVWAQAAAVVSHKSSASSPIRVVVGCIISKRGNKAGVRRPRQRLLGRTSPGKRKPTAAIGRNRPRGRPDANRRASTAIICIGRNQPKGYVAANWQRATWHRGHAPFFLTWPAARQRLYGAARRLGPYPNNNSNSTPPRPHAGARAGWQGSEKSWGRPADFPVKGRLRIVVSRGKKLKSASRATTAVGIERV